MTQEQQTTIASIYEVCISIPEPIFTIQYWEQFGYRIGEVSELTADVAYQLIIWGEFVFTLYLLS